MKFVSVGEDQWLLDPERDFFIAKSIQGGDAYFDAWRVETPQSRPIPGTPFRSLTQAVDACSTDLAEHPRGAPTP